MKFKNILLCLGLGACLTFFAVGCSDDDSNGQTCGNGVCDVDLGENSTNCADDCSCGDGVVDDMEQCEPGDLQGVTCLEFDCDSGTLDCNPNTCEFDISGCTGCEYECGDGSIDGNEECDDGNETDGDGCSAGCLVENGWYCENEPSECVEVICGDGVLDPGEDCDCGTDPNDLPTGCDAINGDPDGTCANDCTEKSPCSLDAWETCNPLEEDQCCPDPYGTEIECTSGLFEDSVCMMPCDTTEECYYSMTCMSQYGVCYPALCGPAAQTQLNAPCQIPGGGTGWCMPLNAASDELGLCIESGDVAHGGTCDNVEGSSIDWTLQPRDMDWDRCDNGLCGTDGTCAEFCDWEEEFEGNSTCPDDTNCLVQSFIYVHDPSDPQSVAEYDGLRWAETGYCIEQSTDPQAGLYTCDLFTGELLTDRPNTCASLNSGDTNYTCQPIYYGNNEFGWGTPVGWCVDSDAPTKALWETCDISSDQCPEGSFCFPTDTTDWQSDGRCMPFCNTTDANSCAGRPGVPVDSECYSVSAWYSPGTDQGEISGETHPTILGFCACPEGGCSGIDTCGDGVLDAGETCDGTDFGGASCTDYGFDGGSLTCSVTCDATDTTDCTSL
jgi:cysteine-rich repeat protein